MRQDIIAVNEPPSVTPTQAIHARLNLGFLLELICVAEPTGFLQSPGAHAQIQIPTAGKETAAIATAERLFMDWIYQLKLTAQPTYLPKLQMTPLGEVNVQVLAEQAALEHAYGAPVDFEHKLGGEESWVGQNCLYIIILEQLSQAVLLIERDRISHAHLLIPRKRI